MTGGFSNQTNQTTGLYIPSTGQYCALPSVVTEGYIQDHTMTEFTLCGGFYSQTQATVPLNWAKVEVNVLRHDQIRNGEKGYRKSNLNDTDTCRTFNLGSGKWEISYQYQPERASHVAWKNEEGILLMGASIFNLNTTTLLLPDGGFRQGFNLKEPALYSCAIEDPRTKNIELHIVILKLCKHQSVFLYIPLKD